jgi:hypothetical protein
VVSCLSRSAGNYLRGRLLHSRLGQRVGDMEVFTVLRSISSTGNCVEKCATELYDHQIIVAAVVALLTAAFVVILFPPELVDFLVSLRFVQAIWNITRPIWGWDLIRKSSARV